MVSSQVIKLLSTNVFKNLAAEEMIFNALPPGSRALVFYVNSPAVVVGRTQNPFYEADVSGAESSAIRIARRRSGGGTVVHDEGNLNFCFMRPRDEHEPKANAGLMVDVLRDSFGIGAGLSERGDIFVDEHKVSGSAYRITRDRAYHHGTLLVNSDLEKLRALLRSPLKENLSVSGAASVRSPVANLVDSAKDITIPSIISALTERFIDSVGELSFKKGKDRCMDFADMIQILTEADVEESFDGFRAEHDELCSGSWVYGQIPRFSYRVFSRDVVGMTDAQVKSPNREGLHVLFMSKGARIETVKRFSSLELAKAAGAHDKKGRGEVDELLTSVLHGCPFQKRTNYNRDYVESVSGMSENVLLHFSDAVPNQYFYPF